MSTDNIDPNKKPTEVPPKDAKTELTEDELSKVSGGILSNLEYMRHEMLKAVANNLRS